MSGPLTGLKVVDAATLFAGPLAATYLGDFGADVIKVEHPLRPDAARGHGQVKDGIGLWWKTLGRNKRTVSLDLKHPDGAATMRRLLADADVLVENFRPGTLERWGLGPDVLLADNPRLVIARVTAFGQDGPYAGRPGFGSLAEAMSGFAAITGEPDGPPTLPPFGLADGIAALATAYAVTAALRHRDATGEGQVVDLAIIEPILMMLGAPLTAYDQLGYVQPRTGNRSVNNAPRNVYRTRDDRWVAVSTSSQSIAERVLRLVGREDLAEQPWFATGGQRAEHADELDEAVGGWIADRDQDAVVAAFEEAQAAVSAVYDVRGVLADPQYRARGTALTVPDDDLGPLVMQNVLFRLSQTPGEVRWAGRRPGADTDDVLAEAGLSADEIARLREDGAVSLVAIYVPGSRPDRFDKAAATGADVILDLEDSVAEADKEAARTVVADWVPRSPVPVQVRVNAPGSAALAADLAALPDDVELRLPKVETTADLDALLGHRVHALVETALGVENAFEIARAGGVVSVALGEADLAAELGLDGEDAFDWVRSRLVVAARAAGLPAPLMSAYADLTDLDGLAASCRRGRRLGLRGRTAVHPRQVPVIRSAFAPSPDELAWATAVIAALEATGVATLADGSMVDAAMERRARSILD